MKQIPLKGGLVALVSDEDYQALSKHRWYNSSGYARRYDKAQKKMVLMHREILGVTDPNICIDHKNRNKVDNRRENLRIATHSQNLQNAGKRSGKCTSKYKGVSYSAPTKKWMAAISFRKKRVILGFYEDEIEAALEYNWWAKKLFGPFAHLNQI